MSDEQAKLDGPDLAAGVPLSALADGAMLRGHVQGKAVLLARRGDELFAIGAVCTHYGAPLEQGLLVDDTVRCPWHHACFSLRTGEAVRAPALKAVPCWQVEQRDNIAYVREQLEPAAPPRVHDAPALMVIVGGGAAGDAAAEMLRREGYAGRITMLSADDSRPYDRPNLSKGFLAGTASDKSNPLRSAKFYEEHGIDLQLGAHVARLDTTNRQVQLVDGRRLAYDALLLATGAMPVRLDVRGADLPNVHVLRTLSDSRALASKAGASQRAVVIGAGFIGLEVAASLRARNVEVCVVGREQCPMERILGPQAGAFIQGLHEQHGVAFRLGATVSEITAHGVTLSTGERLVADLVVVGIGVRPVTELAEAAGLAMDHGVVVNEYLETSAPGVFAAGDIARWPDRLSGERIRVEHWVVAQRQGQTAARNMLGRHEPFEAVPFFWTEQYDFVLAYVGHAQRWDRIDIDGDLAARDCSITYWLGARKLAVALINRDLQGLHDEVELERAVAGTQAR